MLLRFTDLYLFVCKPKMAQKVADWARDTTTPNLNMLYFHIKLSHYSFYRGSRIGLLSFQLVVNTELCRLCYKQASKQTNKQIFDVQAENFKDTSLITTTHHRLLTPMNMTVTSLAVRLLCCLNFYNFCFSHSFKD